MKTVEQYAQDNNIDISNNSQDFIPQPEDLGVDISLIDRNKAELIEILRSVKREGANIDALVEQLEASDFFVAPASTKYHNSFEGGLADHCLNVYKNLVSIVKNKHLEYDEDTLKIVGLLHDISKMNFYEPSSRSVKVYCEDGDKWDDLGKFRWENVKTYSVRKVPNKFIFGSHEQNAAFIVRQYIPLTLEEECAILHHMGGHGDVVGTADLTEIFNTYPLVLLLHTADELSTFIDERIFY